MSKTRAIVTATFAADANGLVQISVKVATRTKEAPIKSKIVSGVFSHHGTYPATFLVHEVTYLAACAADEATYSAASFMDEENHDVILSW